MIEYEIKRSRNYGKVMNSEANENKNNETKKNDCEPSAVEKKHDEQHTMRRRRKLQKKRKSTENKFNKRKYTSTLIRQIRALL